MIINTGVRNGGLTFSQKVQNLIQASFRVQYARVSYKTYFFGWNSDLPEKKLKNN